MAKSQRKRVPKTVPKLPDLEQSKSRVLNSLMSASSKHPYDHATAGSRMRRRERRCGKSYLLADFPLLRAVSRHQITSVRPTNRSQRYLAFSSMPDVTSVLSGLQAPRHASFSLPRPLALPRVRHQVH
jgi:hypothetical protein